MKIFHNFLIKIVMIIMVSIFTATFLYHAFAVSVPQEKDKVGIIKTKEEDKYFSIAFMTYAIALGIIGFFSMYNALEIYKKKEQADKEMRDLLDLYRETVRTVEQKSIETRFDYKETELEVKKLMILFKEEIKIISDKLREERDIHFKDMKSNIGLCVNELEKKQNDIKNDMDIAREDFYSFIKTFTNEFYKHYYTYNLFRLIPHFLDDEKNRNDVKSALLWLSQNGDSDDLETLKGRLDFLSKKPYSDLVEICITAIKELERNLEKERVGQ